MPSIRQEPLLNYAQALSQAQGLKNLQSRNALMQQQYDEGPLRNALVQAKIDDYRNPAPDATSYGKQIQYSIDADNKLHGFAVGDDGTLKELELPEDMTWADTYTLKDLGSYFQLMGKRTGLQGSTASQSTPNPDLTDIPAIGLPQQAASPLSVQADPYAPVLKTVPPEKTPEYKAEVKKAEVKAKFEQEKENLRPKREGAASAAQDRTANLKELVAQARKQATKWTTGFLGAQTKGIPGSPAHDLSQTLLTLQANAGFDRLQEMRDNSVTGGALGQVSERELGLLMAAYAALEQSQSREQFMQNLTRFERQVEQSWKRVKLAYRLDYGEDYQETPAKPVEGEMTDDEYQERKRKLLGG